ERQGDIQGISLAISNRLDMRLHPDQIAPGESDQAEVCGWIRLKDGMPPSARSLMLFSDAFPPSVFPRLGIVGWVPTIELTVHVRQRPAPGWIKGRFRTEDVAAGRMIETGALWDSANTLVAQSRQLGLVLQSSLG
ncbi:MAG: thioesterase family protein, partial [Pseudomonadales bacterium]